MESLGDVTKVKYKPKKRIDLKKLEPESSEENSEPESVEITTSSDEDKDPTKRRKAGGRRPGPASSKQTRSRRSQVSLAASSLEVEGGKTIIKVDGREDVEPITSLEEYIKKVKDDENEVEDDAVPKDKQQDIGSGFLGTGTSTPEILKSLGGNDFMKELKESLDKSTHPAELDIDDGWGDLSPSLEGIDLVGSFDMEDISENPLSSLEAAAETLEEDGSLKESALLPQEYNLHNDLPEVEDQIVLAPSEHLAENQHDKELELL